METFTPGAQAQTPPPLALDQEKDLSALISSAWKIWKSKPSLFVVTAIIVVLPIELLVIGLIGGGFGSRDGTSDDVWAVAAEQLLLFTAGTALITAIHARAVVALAEGRRPTLGEALQIGLRPFLPVLAAIVIYTVFMLIGFVALVIPGIYVTIAGLFAGQSAALTRTGPLASFTASRKLVHANGWWRTFGYSFVLGLIGSIIVVIPTVVITVGAEVVDSRDAGVVWVVLTAVVTAAIMSWTALVTSLQYFSWRAHAGIPFAHPGVGGKDASGTVERDWSAEDSHTGEPTHDHPLR